MRRLLIAAAGLAAGLLGAAPAWADPVPACPPVPAPGYVTCYAESQPTGTSPNRMSASGPAGYRPADLQAAYGLVSAAALNGANQTIAIVDPYDDPSAASDLATYRAAFGLRACTAATGCLLKVNQTGGSALPPSSPSWGLEISLDLDMASAICPNCRVLLVEARSAAYSDMLAAEDYATAHATVVSNSWGGPEFAGESSYDAHLRRSIPITFSTGDSGYGVQYPAASPYVTAVGGTTLTRANRSGRAWSESAWSGSGSGCSRYEPKPAWQPVSACQARTVADVSAEADPNTGPAMFDSFGGAGGWIVGGGTSAAAPVVAATYALAGAQTAAAYNSLPYLHPMSLFDVAGGSNGTCAPAFLCTAGAGYDAPTGLGSPNGLGAF